MVDDRFTEYLKSFLVIYLSFLSVINPSLVNLPYSLPHSSPSTSVHRLPSSHLNNSGSFYLELVKRSYFLVFLKLRSSVPSILHSPYVKNNTHKITLNPSSFTPPETRNNNVNFRFTPYHIPDLVTTVIFLYLPGFLL